MMHFVAHFLLNKKRVIYENNHALIFTFVDFHNTTENKTDTS